MKVSEDLTSTQGEEVQRLLNGYQDVFSEVSGATDLVQHKVEMITNEPGGWRPSECEVGFRS